MCWRIINLKCVEVRSTSWTLLGLHCTVSPHSTISEHFLQTVPPPSTALIVLRPEKGPGYSEVLWESQAEPECELDKRERKRINFLLRLGSLGEGAVFELSLPVCPLPFPKHTTHAHAQTRARTHSSSIPRSSLSVPQPPLHDLHLATLLSRGVWRDANLVQDRVIALGTYPANPL